MYSSFEQKNAVLCYLILLEFESEMYENQGRAQRGGKGGKSLFDFLKGGNPPLNFPPFHINFPTFPPLDLSFPP